MKVQFLETVGFEGAHYVAGQTYDLSATVVAALGDSVREVKSETKQAEAPQNKMVKQAGTSK